MTRASGQLSSVGPLNRGWIAGLIAAGAVLGAGAIVLATRHPPEAPPAHAASGVPEASAVAAPDAASHPDAPAPIDAGVASEPDAPTVAIDAGTPVDAGRKPRDRQPPVTHVVVHPPATPESSHAHQQAGSGSAIHIDRGD